MQKDIENKIKHTAPFQHKIDRVYSSISKGSFLDRLKESNAKENEEDLELNQEVFFYYYYFYFLLTNFHLIFSHMKLNQHGMFWEMIM